MVLLWRHPTIRMAMASCKGGGNIPVTRRGCAETYLIFRTGGVGNTNEYLTLGVPFVLAFLFLLHIFHKLNVCLQMIWMFLRLFSCHRFSRFPQLFIYLLWIKVKTQSLHKSSIRKSGLMSAAGRGLRREQRWSCEPVFQSGSVVFRLWFLLQVYWYDYKLFTGYIKNGWDLLTSYKNQPLQGILSLFLLLKNNYFQRLIHCIVGEKTK